MLWAIKQSFALFCSCSYDFNGDIVAYGANNDNPTNSIKGAPGTVYYRHDTFEQEESAPKVLWVLGDTEDSLQEQSETMLSGILEDDFVYDVVSLEGMFKRSFWGSLAKSIFWLFRMNRQDSCQYLT